jgi:twitching motility protein PilT
VETLGFYPEPDAAPPGQVPPDGSPGAAAAAYSDEPDWSPHAPGVTPPTPVYPLGADALSAPPLPPATTGVGTAPAPFAGEFGQQPAAQFAPPALAPTQPAPPASMPAATGMASGPALQPLAPPPAADAPAANGVALQPPSGEMFPTNGTGMSQPKLVDGLSLTDMLVAVLERNASDLHLTAGARPTLRLNGSLTPMDDLPVLTPPVIQQMMYEILTQKQRERFEEHLELDFAYAVPGRARFRVNLYRQREALGAAFRLIPYEIKKLETLGIPPSVSNFAMMPRGFVLVTGPTGSGKSTTLAGIIDLANRQRRDHIMTVEDPIEFLHTHKSCLVNQREVGDDTHSFANALKHVLRQDPDIILVGEMRDLETISVALTAAETGHLVFATLHTQDAAQTIDRVIDVFPPHQQQQVRVQLAGSLQGVVAQTLCKSTDGRSRIVATEVLVATPAIRNLIREGKTHQIYSALQAGAKHGMHTMDQHLAELVKGGRITYDTGLEKCHHVEDFNRLAGRS